MLEAHLDLDKMRRQHIKRDESLYTLPGLHWYEGCKIEYCAPYAMLFRVHSGYNAVQRPQSFCNYKE